MTCPAMSVLSYPCDTEFHRADDLLFVPVVDVDILLVLPVLVDSVADLWML
jgi:hypothetical protein